MVWSRFFLLSAYANVRKCLSEPQQLYATYAKACRKRKNFTQTYETYASSQEPLPELGSVDHF